MWQWRFMQGSRYDRALFQSFVQWQFVKQRSQDLPRSALLALHAFVEALLPR